jgi:hypothetical protein
MSLINSEYPVFTNGSYRLNLQELDSDMFDDTCARVEFDILSMLFGDAMYLDYENNPTRTDILELVDGYKVDDELATYTYNGKKYVYRGLKDMLAYFTYFHYIQGQFNFNPTIAEKINAAIEISPEQNSLRAYNLGYKGYYDAYNFIKYKQSLGTGLFADFDFTDIELINSFGI